jgi:hypothetical protein
MAVGTYDLTSLQFLNHPTPASSDGAHPATKHGLHMIELHTLRIIVLSAVYTRLHDLQEPKE